MDGFGHDVAQKIKAAIKAKLIELDAYVDDELPDYIMVMVANKKTKANMTEDLNLFLSENTETFTDWLHDVLEKLQSVSLEGSKTRNKTNKSKNKEPDVKAAEGHTEAVSTSEKASEVSLAAVVQTNASVATGDSQDDVLAIDAEQETDDIFADEIKEVDELTKPTIIHPPPPPPSTVPRLPDTSSKPKAVTRPHVNRTRISTLKVDEKNISNVNQQPLNLTIGSRANGTTTSSPDVVQVSKSYPAPEICSRKRKAPSSMVGAVLQRQFPQEDEEEEDGYDPRHPVIGSVASIVQVTQRRSSVPPERQANKALLLKAVNEAHKSVLGSSRIMTENSSASQQLFTKRYLSERQLMEQSNINKLASVRPYNVERRAVLLAPRSQQQEKQLVTRSTSPIPREDVVDPVQDVTYEEMSVENEDNEQTRMYSPEQCEDQNEMIQIESLPNTASPKFIITLDGVDAENMFASSYSNLDQNESERTVHMEEALEITANDDYDLELQSDRESLYSGGDESEMTIPKEQETFTSTDGSEDVSSGKRLKLTERCRFWPSCRNGVGCPYQHPTVSCKAFPNCKFGIRCLYVHPNCKFDSACTRRECPFTHASKNMPKEQNNHETQLTLEMTPIAVSTPLAHRRSNHVLPLSSSSLSSLSSSSQQPSHKVQCRNFPKCNNVDCTFLHPKPCRYGINCTRSDCVFSHPSLPSRNQLRWTSQPSPDLMQHISQRSFSLS